MIALSTGNVVVFWLFTRALFDETFKLRWWHGLVWAVVVAFSFVNCMWIAPASGARVSIIAVNLVALGFIALAVAQTIASWSADLVERRRGVRGLHRQRRRAVWRHECGAADIFAVVAEESSTP